MASLRKRLSRWALGDGDGDVKRPVSLEVNRGSIDSGYHSTSRNRLSQIPSLSPIKDTPEKSPRSLHKTLSTTFGFLADTMRQGVTSLHQEYSKDDNLSEQSEFVTPPQTPKKQRRRSSLFSSVRGRKFASSPRSEKIAIDSPVSPDLSPIPSNYIEEPAPVLRVPIPDARLNEDSPDRVSAIRTASNAKVPWPSPASIAVGSEDLYIDRDDLSTRIRLFLNSTLADSACQKANTSCRDDKGYAAESESGAEPSDGEAISPLVEQHVTSGPSEPTTLSIGYPQVTPRVRLDDGSGSPRNFKPPPRSSSIMSASPVVRSQLSSGRPETKQGGSRLPSYMYEADAEVSETSPEVTPSMGSRAIWERARADRSQRYLAAIGDNVDKDTGSSIKVNIPESRPGSPESLEGNGSPKFKAIGEQIRRPPYPTGALKYAVEAAERQSGANLIDGEDDILSLDLGDQASTSMLSMRLTVDEIMALGQASNPKAEENLGSIYDSETDVSDNCHSLQSTAPQLEDAFEAGLRAAGLSSWTHPEQHFITVPRNRRQGLPNQDLQTRSPRPVSHFRSASSLSEATNDSCAITTNSPSCDATPPFPVLHVRSEPARRFSNIVDTLNGVERVDIPLTGPANAGLAASSLKSTSSGIADSDAAHLNEINTNPGEIEVEIAASASIGSNTGQSKNESRESTPGKASPAFNAARLPSFNSTSPKGLSPRSSLSLRRKRRERGRMPFPEASGNAIKRESVQKKADSPHFTVKHFKSFSGESSPYAGHELDPVSFDASTSQQDPGSSPTTRDKKAVCFAEDIEIIGSAGESKVDARESVDVHSNESKWTRFQQGFERELEEKQELALSRLKKKLESDDPEEVPLGKENVDPDEIQKVVKPRWRMPSKITDTIM